MTSRYEAHEELRGTGLHRLARARHVATGATVIVKTPRHQPAPTSDIELLRRERALLAALNHPHIAQPFGEPESDVLPVHDRGGVPLASLIVSGVPELGVTLSVGAQLADVLHTLHSRGVVHNGLRPEIIFWDAAQAHTWLIDVSDACGGAAGATPASGQILSADRLVYVSPEQTGRMNRAADHRSDLYSLGVVLYELLTGAPPFRSDDPAELVHAHIARQAPAPKELNATIPPAVSDIVMRLLAKNADERYRHALGLQHDLERCAREWREYGSVADFALGSGDVSDDFVVSKKLYGRREEVATLLRAFDRACEGTGQASSMVLVSGYSGIGKTALIQELYRPIVRQRGYFVSGKFDQVVRSIPFGALIQAFRALVKQLLTESEARVAQWRKRLTLALGSNGGVLAEVIPEIELIIGKQPLTLALGPTEALNRFQLMFQNFVAALARPEHPLVVFLDDLQWADAATLGLFEPLLSSREIACLCLVGAYRDNEVDALHPLRRTFGALESAGVELQRVSLGPLRLPDLTELIADTLRTSAADAEPLARLVLQKTGGNPFFVSQFLKTLNDEGYLRFDYAARCWVYDLAAVARAPLTDNVIDLMTRKIQRLPRSTQRALTLAACIGDPFDQATLALVSEQPALAAAEDLAEAVREGLILPTPGIAADAPSPSYGFLHDRVQQAAYALIPPQQKAQAHLAIGRLLRGQLNAEPPEERVFQLAHHLNLGVALISDASERLALARLNLAAGRKAKASTAHEAARDYFRAGLNVLSESHWFADYELSFALHLAAAESEYLCRHFDAAEAQFAVLLQRAASNLDKARVYRLRGLQYENMSRYADAMASARQGLALFGVAFPESAQDKEAALEREITAVHQLLAGRSIASLVDLPAMTDAAVRMVMNIVTDMWASAYILGDPVLARLISATMVRLSLQHGNVEESAYGYVTHAITVGPARGDYGAAYEFGKLALAVNQRFNDARRRAKIHQQFHAHVNFWRQPWRTCLPYAREACRSGLESGDFLYAAYGASTETWAAMQATQDLAQFVRDYTPTVALVRKLKNAGFADSAAIILNWARALQGSSSAPLALSDQGIDEQSYIAAYRDNPFFFTLYAVPKLHVCYLLAEPAQALAAARTAQQYAHQLAGTVWPLYFDFYNALTLAANFASAAMQERDAFLVEVTRAQTEFARLAQNCPENFLCQSLLLAAEIERISERPREALPLYEEAIGYAQQTGDVQQLALAYELCAKFRNGCGQRHIAALFIGEARAHYARWGAGAKVAQLERVFAALRGGETAGPQAPAGTGDGAETRAEGASTTLDFVSVMKAGQALAREIEMNQLLAKLMRIVIENAGAQRGSLLLQDNDEWRVQAEGSLDADGVQLERALPLAEAQNLPASVVNYVRRTGETVVLADARADERFGSDPYIVRSGARSILCIPVLKQSRLVGVLYLENNALSGAFTPERSETVQMIAAEAAISLENARLFEGLKREINERGRAQEELRAALTEVQRLKNELEAENAYLRHDLIVNVSHDLRTPLTSLRGYLETLLARQEQLSPRQQHNYLEIAMRQSERLSTLVDELFELAKLDFKGVELHFESLQLAEFASDVVSKFQLSAEQKSIALSVEAVDDIPLIRADVGLLERVFDNLIGNALRHTPAGGTIKVTVATSGERALVRVADSGSGIPEADIPSIFNRFYRVDKNRVGSGAGLGLAIAKRIIELHEGSIGVASTPNAGTCFSFELPLRPRLDQRVA